MPLKTYDEKSGRARKKIEREERKALERVAREEAQAEREREATGKAMTMTTRAALSGRDLPSRPHMYEDRRKRKAKASFDARAVDSAVTYAKLSREIDDEPTPSRTRGPAPVPFIQPGAPRPGGPAQFDTVNPYLRGKATAREQRIRPLTTSSFAGPGDFSRTNPLVSPAQDDPLQSLVEQTWSEYVRAGYKLTPAVEDGIRKIRQFRENPTLGSLQDMRLAQKLDPVRDASLDAESAISGLVGPYIATRFPGGAAPKQDISAWDIVDFASLAPVGRAARGAGAGARALGLADDITRAVDAITGVKTIKYAATGKGTTAGKMAVREFNKFGDSVLAPAAQSRVGQLVERGWEAARPFTSRATLGLVRSPIKKAGAVRKEIEETGQLLRGAQANRLAKDAKDLSLGEGGALRFLAEHGKGSADELDIRIAFHDEQARRWWDEAAGVADPGERAIVEDNARFSEMWREAFEQAKQYVRHTDTPGLDGMTWVPTNSEKLEKAWDSYGKVEGGREEILRFFGLLSDETLETRKGLPARIARGAKYDYPSGREVVERLRDVEGVGEEGMVGLRVRALDRDNIGTIREVAKGKALVYFRNIMEGTEAEVWLPLEKLKVMDRVLVGDEVVQAAVRGFEDVVSGARYAPQAPGLPVRASLRNPSSWFQSVRNFNAGRRGTRARLEVKDASLLNQLTGGAMETGYFTTDPSGAMVESAQKANRIVHAERLRSVANTVGTPKPLGIHDIAVVVDKAKVDKNISPELKRVFEMMEEGRALGLSTLDDIRIDDVNDAVASIMPRTTDVKAGKEMDAYLRRMMRTQALEEIPGIKWVNPVYADAVGMSTRGAQKMARAQFVEWLRLDGTAQDLVGAGGAVLGSGADAINNLNKMVALYFNPAYPVVQRMGNEALLLTQQGLARPVAMKRGYTMWKGLDDEAQEMVLALVGEGFFSAASRYDVNKRMGEIMSRLIDVGPRVNAFMYEAHKMGIRNSDDLKRLLQAAKKNDGALQQVSLLRRKTLNAMVDFNRLNAFERAVITRGIWFYPWMKGAAYWSVRYPLDHPYQALAFTFFEKERREGLPDGPYYTQQMFRIPGTDKVLPVSQVLPPYQLLSLADAGRGWLTGERNLPPIAEIATPVTAAIGRSVFGGVTDYGAPIQPGFGTFVEGVTDILSEPPVVRSIKRALRSDEERAEDNEAGLYRTTRTEDYIRIFGGSGPIPRGYNEERWASTARAMRGERKSQADKTKDELADLGEKIGGKEIPGWAEEIVQKRVSVNERADMIREGMREDLDRDELTDHESNVARVEALLDELYGPDSDRHKSYLAQAKRNARLASKLVARFEKQLGFGRLSKWTSYQKARVESVVR